MASGTQTGGDVICLVGPKGSGKTSLLKYWPMSFDFHTHGFDSCGIDAIRKTDEARTQNGARKPLNFAERVRTGASAEAKTFLRKQDDTVETKSHFFEISMRAGERRTLEIVDSPGELLVPGQEDSAVVSAENKERLNDALARANGVIIAIPMVNLTESPELSAIQELVEMLTEAERPPNLRTLVLAFTHCERRFIHLGNRAFRHAANPANMKDLIQKHFDTMPWSNVVKSFGQRPGHRVFVTASGSLGFVSGNGSVNIDPHGFLARTAVEGEAEAPADASERELQRARYIEAIFQRTDQWQPFLTAEPFLCAFFERAGDYSIDLEAPVKPMQPQVRPSRADKERLEPEGNKISWLRQLYSWLKELTNVPE